MFTSHLTISNLHVKITSHEITNETNGGPATITLADFNELCRGIASAHGHRGQPAPRNVEALDSGALEGDGADEGGTIFPTSGDRKMDKGGDTK